MNNNIIEQVYKCDFVFGSDPLVEFDIFSKERKRLIDLRDFDNMISAIDGLILKNNTVKSVKSTKTKQSSFRYKKYDTAPLKINKLYKELKGKNFIHPDTKLVNFKKVFSGGEIEEPIIWVGMISELWYFITQLHNDLKYVENLKLEVWTVAMNCFVQEDGTPYGRKKIKNQKAPKTSISIDKALTTLNLPSTLSRK